jgi:DNA-binding transcriptional regulator YiaG
MINKIHFGKRIAMLRRKSKLSQVVMAKKLGVTSQAVSKWE